MRTPSPNPAKGNFFQDVYEVVKLIPPGRVTSYGAIAAYLGAKGSARMVGWALIASHAQQGIPAYRVVNRNGLLTGKQHFESYSAMQEHLEREGIQIKDDKVVDFDKRFWDPAQELLQPHKSVHGKIPVFGLFFKKQAENRNY